MPNPWDVVVDVVEDAVEDTTESAGDVAEAVVDTAEDAYDAATGAAESSGTAAQAAAEHGVSVIAVSVAAAAALAGSEVAAAAGAVAGGAAIVATLVVISAAAVAAGASLGAGVAAGGIVAGARIVTGLSSLPGKLAATRAALIAAERARIKKVEVDTGRAEGAFNDLIGKLKALREEERKRAGKGNHARAELIAKLEKLAGGLKDLLNAVVKAGVPASSKSPGHLQRVEELTSRLFTLVLAKGLSTPAKVTMLSNLQLLKARLQAANLHLATARHLQPVPGGKPGVPKTIGG